jgi:drug/metabolite transporter (DMT)-like permease
LQQPWTIWGALGAALAVALFGTVGRVLRTAALPAAGVTAVAASSQINALFTALGGVLLLNDSVTPVSLVCTVLAAALGATAVVAAARWRLSRTPDLGLALDS